jgi:hypothetical protein
VEVAKDLPSWVLDADAWEHFVIDIDNPPAGSRVHLSPEESDDKDISSDSEESIDVDDGSDKKEGKEITTEQEVNNTEENEEGGHWHRLLRPQPLTTHDKGMRRRVRPIVLRVPMAIYQHPQPFHVAEPKWNRKNNGRWMKRPKEMTRQRTPKI